MASAPTDSPSPPNSTMGPAPPPDPMTKPTPPPPISKTATPPTNATLNVTTPADSNPPPADSNPPPGASSPPPAASNPPPAEVKLRPPPATAKSSPPPLASSPPITVAPPPTVPTPPPQLAATPPAQEDKSSPPPPASVISPPPPTGSSPAPTTNSAPSPATATDSTPPPPAVPILSPPGTKKAAPPPAYETTPSPPGTTETTTLSPPRTTAKSAPPPPGLTSHSSSRSSSPPSDSSSGLSGGAVTGIGLAVAFIMLSFVGIICYNRRKRRPMMEGYQQQVYHHGFGMPSGQYSPHQLSGETPFLLASPHRPGPMNYSGGPPGSNNYSSGNYNSGPNYNSGMNYNSSNYNNSDNFTSGSGKGGGKMRVAPSDLSIGGSQSSFSYEELYNITSGFAPENILGEGGFGCVYKGRLSDGKEVAVKQLKGGGGQGEREFQAEVEIISRVHHRHLVSLVGYCISEDQRLLVYDFVSNGTLHYHLHARGRPCMEWSTRVKVAAGAARGLAYLHEDCHPRIIHRDIKSSNILLDDYFEAQVADFGLARLAENDVTHVSTRVMGTFGYLAPEYASTGKLTERSDVFSYGVVLLELITGRKPVDGNRPLGEESLVEWARPHLTEALESGDFKELVDPRLEKNYKEVEMFRLVETAAACIRHSASRRPKMSQVVRALDSLTDEVDISNGMEIGKSQMFNVANTADIRLFQKMAFGSQEFSTEYSRASTNSNINSRNF